jgi:branched-chain amino acid transport system permease protein
MAASSEALPAASRRPTISVGGLVARGLVIVGLICLVTVVPMTFLGEQQQTQASLAAIYAIVGLSMNILVGYAGQISLGQQAFVGIGALTAANVASTGIDPADPFMFGVSLVAAAGVGAGTALLLGAVALRITGLYLALVTLIFGSVCANAIFTIEALNGDSAGVPTVRPEALAGEAPFFLFCLAVVALALYIDWSFSRTKAGRAVNALRENEQVAQAFAVNVVAYKLLAFSLSGALAGLAGGIFAYRTESFSDKSFTSTAGFTLALIFLVMVVVGGLRSRFGVVIASVFFGLLAPLLDKVFDLANVADWYIDHKNYIPGFIGAVLLLQTIIMNPGGLGQVIRPVERWLAGGRFTFHDEEAAGAESGGRHVRA